MNLPCFYSLRTFGRTVVAAAALITGFAGTADAGLSEAERVILEQPACAQMKSYSQDITLLNDEMQNVRRSPNRRRLCDVLRRSVTTIGQLDADRRKVCR